MGKAWLFGAVANLIAVSQGMSAPVLWNGNGNYYDLVAATNIKWVDARDVAAGLSFLGAPGHLATITSAPENSFIATSFNTSATTLAWIGGHLPNDDGVWRWAVGPEAGTQFSIFATATTPYNFANWGGIEPNEAFVGANYAAFNLGQSSGGVSTGQWADLVQTPTKFALVVGYLVEFEMNSVPEPSAFLVILFGSATLLTARRRVPISANRFPELCL